MNDETEALRMARVVDLNSGLTQEETAARAQLEAEYGQVWSTDQLREEFAVIGFIAPYVVVRRLSTREKGSLEFTHWPRFYFNWVSDHE